MSDAWNGSWGTSWGTSWQAGAAPPAVVISPTGGGIPLSYKEWVRRRRKDERETEEDDAPPRPQVVEIVGYAQPKTEFRAPPRSPALARALLDAENVTKELTRSQLRRIQRNAKRRRADDEWFLLN